MPSMVHLDPGLYRVGKGGLQMTHPDGVTCRTSWVVCSKRWRPGFLTCSKDCENGIRNITWEEAQKTTFRTAAKCFTGEHARWAAFRLARVRWWGCCLPLSFWLQGAISCIHELIRFSFNLSVRKLWCLLVGLWVWVCRLCIVWRVQACQVTGKCPS
jgi:hypothetical protein